MLGSEQSGKLPSRSSSTSQENAKRRDPTQPLAEHIVKLRGAVLPRERHEHFYVAESPLSPGVNPLLLAVEDPGGKHTFRQVLAVLPTWGIHVEPCDSLLYKAALGRVRAKYRRLISDLASVDLAELLPTERVDGRRAGNSIPLWLSEQLSDFVKEAKGQDVSTRLLSTISDLLRHRPHNDPSVIPWDVFHLQYDVPDTIREPDWYIFAKWEDWLARKFSSRECFNEYIEHHKEHGNPNSFNGHLRFLGLPIPLKEGVKKRRERGWQLKQAMRERQNPERPI